MDILDDMGVSKLSAKVFLKVNYSFNYAWLFISESFFEGDQFLFQCMGHLCVSEFM